MKQIHGQSNNLPQQWEKTTQLEDFVPEIYDFCRVSGGVASVLEKAELLHASRSWGNGDVYLMTLVGRRFVMKSYRNRPWLVRHGLGHRILHHEMEAGIVFRRDGLARVPRPYALLDYDTAAWEYIPNQGQIPGPRQKDKLPPIVFFEELREMLWNLHAAGCCHGDIRRANVLVGLDGHPWLVDLATSLWRSHGVLDQLLYPIMKLADRFSLARIFSTSYPQLLDEEMVELLRRPPAVLRIARMVRQKVYKPCFRSSR